MTVLAARSGSEAFAGTGSLVRFALRRDRFRLGVWVLCLGLLCVYAAVMLDHTYPTAADRQLRAALLANPAAVLLSGPGYGTADYTLGAMIANELGLSVMVAAAIMSIQLVVRQTRAEEESGRAELVRAGAVGRRAGLTAGLVQTALADAAVAAVVTVGLAGYGLALSDSLALAVGIGVTGLVFGAVAACTAQLTEHARGATGWALAVLAAAVLVRGVGDILEPGGSALSWLSPIAWAQQTRAFVDLRWWPLLLPAVLIVVLLAVADGLVHVRDFGAGLVAPRRGPGRASALLSGPAGLAARTQRAAVISWAVALLISGVVFGSLADEVTDMATGNEQFQAILEQVGGAAPTDGFTAFTALYLALAVGAFAISSVLRLHGEEAAGRTEVLLATALDRRRYLGAGLAVAAGGATLLLVAGGLGAGVAAALVRGDAGQVDRNLEAHLVHLPAVLVLAGVAGVLVGVAPRWTGLAWVVVTGTVVVGLFGALLGLPDWVQHLSPFGWVPSVPAEPFDVVPLAALLLLAAALVGCGLAGFRRRDVPTA